MMHHSNVVLGVLLLICSLLSGLALGLVMPPSSSLTTARFNINKPHNHDNGCRSTLYYGHSDVKFRTNSRNIKSHLSSSLLTQASAVASSSSSTRQALAAAVLSSSPPPLTVAVPSAIAIGTRRILAFLTTSITNSNIKRSIKTMINLILLSIASYTILDILQTNKRQSVDLTSEWSRYANYPILRGMAISLLMIRLIPYIILPWLLDKLSSLLSKKKKNMTTDNITTTDDEITMHNNTNEKSNYAHRLRKRGGEIFANGLLKLGPLYIKIGQILSCRKNLFPTEWITAMEKLQDCVPAKSGHEAYELLYAAYPGGQTAFDAMFTNFNDTPLAAASLGQVHTATLRSSGERVAIKIQRSKLREIYNQDLSMMKSIASFVDKVGSSKAQVGGIEQSWTTIFTDAENILYREIDYNDEAENAIRFASDFGLGLHGTAITCTAQDLDGKALPSAAPYLRTPYIYRDLCSEKFLCMEYVPSIKVSDNVKLNEAGVSIEDREYLAEALAHSYLRQFCSNKFFSTDPHPGNLGIEVFPNDSKRLPRLVFYDFGQACSLSNDQARGILDVMESIIDLDAKKSVLAFSRMGVLKDTADLQKVEAKCQQNYDTGMLLVKKRKKRSGTRYGSSSSGSKSNSSMNERYDIELEKRLDDASSLTPPTAVGSGEKVNDVEIMGYFTLQSEYAFVARALSQLDGVGKGLDPDFDFLSAAAPYMVEIKGTGRYLVDEMKKRLSWK